MGGDETVAELADNKGRLDGLTGIRFFAAMVVVLFHVGYTPIAKISPFLASVTDHGYAAVGLFYTLSGFVLAYTYANRKPDVRAFYVARFARVYPVYLLALLLAFPIFFQRTFRHGLTGFLGPLATAPLMLQSWWSPMALVWNGPAWSLSVEAFFYLLFPAILAFHMRRTPRECLWVAAAMWPIGLIPPLLYCWVNPDSLGSMTGLRTEALSRAEIFGWLGTVVFNPLFRLPEFVAGVAVGCAFRMGYRRLPWIALLVPACVLFVAGMLPYPVVHNAWLLPVWCVLVLALASPLAAGRWFWTAPWMILLGEASYGIYILQYPVSNWFKAIVSKTTGREIQGDYPSLAWLAAYCVVLLGASIMSYYFIENPSRAWIRERFGKSRVSRKLESPVR